MPLFATAAGVVVAASPQTKGRIVSPRIVPAGAVTVYAPPRGSGEAPADVKAVTDEIERTNAEKLLRCSAAEPYQPGCPHSFFRDLLAVSRRTRRIERAIENPVLQGRDPGEIPAPGDRDENLEHVRGRLAQAYRTAQYEAERRDLSSANTTEALRPSAPGYLAETFGRASRATGTLAEAIGARPLEPGMVDTSSGVPVLTLPRLTTGAAMAVQTSQNAAIQETDPAAAMVSSPVATIAGQVDYSRQLADFSRPGMDGVIADDLGRDFGTKLDTQIVNGTALSGQTRGLLSVAGILSIAGAVTSVQAFIADVWQAFQELAGASGIGNPDPDAYMTILHPRRLAWIYSGAGAASVPGAPILPGRVVASAGIPTNLGAGTNEDVALVVERENLLLAARRPTFNVDEDTGSATLTVRTQAWAYVSLLTKNPAGVAKVTGLTPPTY